MSLSIVKPYVATQMETLGYARWPDGFGDDNIPSTIVDRSFHSKVTNVSGVGLNQETLEYLVTIQVKVYFKGFTDPSSAIDQSLIEAEGIIVKILDLVDYTAAGIKGITFTSLNVEPFDEVQNDNLVVATFEYDARVFSCLT